MSLCQTIVASPGRFWRWLAEGMSNAWRLCAGAARWLGRSIAIAFRGLGAGIGGAWVWIGANKEQLTILFAVVAGLYVLVEYRRNETDANIKRTMEFQARYAQSEILAARLKLESFWLNPESEKYLKAAPGTPAEQYTRVVLDHKLDGHVFLLADFMGQLTTCLKNKLCELATACPAFRGQVVAVRNTYFDLFRTWEKRWGENLIKEPFEYFTAKCPK